MDDPGARARELELNLEDIATSVTGSITSTLSSASHSAMMQCQSFLASQSSNMASFFNEHSTQLSSLYARSIALDSRETQLHHMIRTYTESAKRQEADTPKVELLQIAVEDNTRQVSQLVDTLRTTPTLHHAHPDSILDSLPQLDPSPSDDLQHQLQPTLEDEPVSTPTADPLFTLTFLAPTTLTADSHDSQAPEPMSPTIMT
jgi:hypothetical protein